MSKALNRADAEYHRLLLDIMGQGRWTGDRTGTGTKSIFGKQIRFDMANGFPLLTTKKLHTKSIIHELIWFLNGDTNTKYLNENGVTIWDEWADENGDLGPVYGKQWVSWNTGWFEPNDGKFEKYQIKTINQIQNAVDRLKTNPDCRRIIVSAWNVGELDQMALVPCHNFFQLKSYLLSEDERKEYWCRIHQKDSSYTEKMDMEDLDKVGCPTRILDLMWNQRSVDTFLGLPFNIASYAFLLHMIAQQVNMVPGTLIGNLGDTHIYSNHIDYVKEQMYRGSKAEQPTLKLNKAKDIFSYKYEDFEICDYDAHPNWKGVPIAV